MPALLDAVKGSRIIETLENYPIAFHTTRLNDDLSPPRESIWIHDDSDFWQAVLQSPEDYWNTNFNIGFCIFTNWIARVPGLFHTEGASTLRLFAEYYPLENTVQFGDINHIYQ